MKKLLLDPLFLAGLLLRLVLIGLALPAAAMQWYVPFMNVSTHSFSTDPWTAWLASGGTPIAFPYGYAMWLCFLPLTLICKGLGMPLLYGYAGTLLCVDFIMLNLLGRMIPGRVRLLLSVYWFSPIVIVATYLLGLNDLIPVTLLVLSLHHFRRHRLALSGFVFIAAISAKASMVIALPFFIIYFAHNLAYRRFLPRFVAGIALGGVLLLVPYLALSHSAVMMLLSNPETGKVFRLTMDLGPTFSIYLVPLVYILVLYAAWRVKRMNFDLFQAMLGLGFMAVVLMTPASPGWFIWLTPLLLTYQAMGDRVATMLAWLFSILYVISSMLELAPGTIVVGGVFFDASRLLADHFGRRFPSLFYTAMVAIGAVLAVRIWRQTVSRNDFFRLSRKPFVLGIAGDSGAGKDTFADAIEGLFGQHSVTMLTGDDYHLWDRQRPMWQVMTHLNPVANDLDRFASDLVSLIDGKPVQSTHYDHQTGRMSRPRAIRSNDFIIASGLHALYLPIARRCYDLSIYLDIDEDLRRYFKMRRDVTVRGHSVAQVEASFLRREPDAARFIRPQALEADLILSLQPIHPRMLEDIRVEQTLPFKLVVQSRHGLSSISLTRALVGVCGLHVDEIPARDGSRIAFAIEGDTSAADIEMAARMICPRIFEFLDTVPVWQDGMMGLMQLVTLSHINQALTERFIW
ncbi:uridine kinase [Robbsia sp. Bb-Pol-6]|uniref:phosphoribulokinase n=1 Tax=Robbsia betulipollinis TaxID=2981849 RepID=A0ABT3ZM06_9BURK|nr:uridine kinase [Robbsia betulipollinis]MCY0387559.1 uridine kinase [Robbsia betulipollinis]